MDLKEILGELYSAEIANKLKAVDIFDKGKAMPIEKFNSKMEEVNNQKKELKEQVDTLNTALTDNNNSIESMKKLADQHPELQKQLKEYQVKVAATQKEFGETLTAKETEWQQRETNNLKKFKAMEKIFSKHPKNDYMEELEWHVSKNIDKITSNSDGTYNGIDDIVESIYKSKPDMFGKPVTIGTGLNGGNGNVQNANLQALADKAKSGKPDDRMAYMKAKQGTNENE